jgi:glutamate N-acetyltransferase/amino-acid N-acetyltransferase
MIAPNMATMLGFVTTDAAISRTLLQRALDAAVKVSFNRVTVDGDTSTNDTILVLSNGAAGNRRISADGPAYAKFRGALTWVCQQLAWKVVSDGEGVTKVFEVDVRGARNGADAEKAARAVACSPLVKTAVFGEDMNWGRIVNAAGYSGAEFDPSLLDLSIGGVALLRKGRMIRKNVGGAERAVRLPFFTVRLGLNAGRSSASVLTTDFSYDYVRINADYRS